MKFFKLFKAKKEEIWLSPMSKAPTPHRKSKKQRDNTNTLQNFDYTMIADRPRTVSWSNDINQTDMVKLVYGKPTF